MAHEKKSTWKKSIADHAEEAGVDARLLLLAMWLGVWLLLGLIFGMPGAQAAECTGGGTQVYLSTTYKSSSFTLSGSNLIATKNVSADNAFAGGATSKSSGKWYFEVRVTGPGPNSNMVGIVPLGQAVDSFPVNQYSYHNLGNTHSHGTATGGVPSYAGGDYIGVAVDLTAGKIWFSKNGTYIASGNPATGASPRYSGLSGSFVSYVNAAYVNNVFTVNYGGAAFNTAPPAGFQSWGGSPVTCVGQFTCTSSNGTTCATWQEMTPDALDMATLEDMGVTGEMLGLAYAFGVGMILAHSVFGQSFGAVVSGLRKALGAP